MPQPTGSDLHTDAVLTNISVAYIQSRSEYVSQQLFPTVRVSKKSDLYYTYTKGDWYRDEAAVRAPGTESAGSGWTVSSDSYLCNVYAMHKDLDDQTRANADDPFNLDREAVEFVTQRMLLRQELDWISSYFTTGVWDTDSTPSTTWDDYTGSDPISDVETAKRTIKINTGLDANFLLLGYDVMQQLRHHPDIVDRTKYTSSEVTTEALLARLFGVDRVMTASSIYNTAAEGATTSMSFIHGKHALLCHTAPTPGLLTPSAGYRFVWSGVSDGLGQEVGITRFRMPELRSDRVEAQMAWDFKVVSSDLGYFFNGAVA